MPCSCRCLRVFSAIAWLFVASDCVLRFAFVVDSRFSLRICLWLLRNRALSPLEFIFSRYLFWAAAAAGARPGQAPLFLFEILLYPLHLLFFSLGYTMHSL